MTDDVYFGKLLSNAVGDKYMDPYLREKLMNK